MTSVIIGRFKYRPAADKANSITLFLAHLWGAYAIPVVLSGVRRVSFVSTITTRNN